MDISDVTKNKIKSNKGKQRKDRQLNTSLKRRTLVKGSAAVLPTIFTLRSGGVLAQAMPSITCEDKSKAQGEPVLISLTDADELGRTSALQRELTVGIGNTILVFSISDDPGETWVTQDDPPELWRDSTTGTALQMEQVSDPQVTGDYTMTTPVFILACPADDDGTPVLFCGDAHADVPVSCLISLGLATTDPIV